MSSTLPHTPKFLYIRGEKTQESALQVLHNVFPLHTMFVADIVISPPQTPGLPNDNLDIKIINILYQDNFVKQGFL
jgi:hypothetical protein